MGALPRPGVTPGPHRELVDALHALHHRAGWPSLRRLAAQTGVSHTTVSKVFSSPALPGWGTLELLVEAMGGDVGRFQALWLAASAPDALPRGPGMPIAGRGAELAVVRRHLEAGSGLLLVTGEAGMGKTTVVAAAASTVEAHVAVGHCLHLSREVPLLPVIDTLRALLDVGGGGWMRESLAGCPGYVRRSLARLLPELEADAPAPPDDPWGMERLMASVTSLLRAMHSGHPLAVHLEDCHWADRSTLDLLAHFAAGPSPVPVVTTWRTGDLAVGREHLDWLSMAEWTPGVVTVALEPLTLEETAEQLRLLTGAPASPDAAARIHVRSQVLPLYTAQLAHSQEGELPQHLADLLDRRFAHLDGEAWQVARVLGLAQRRVGPTLLRTVTGLDPERADEALRGLARRGLLRTGTGDGAELAHPLFVDAVRRRLLPGEGARVHARLAGALVDEAGIEPAEVADHWQAAGRADLEATHRVSAARRAGERFAYRDALVAWLRVLELWDAGERPDGVELWDVLSCALEVADDAGDFDVGRRLARRARELDVPDRVARATMLQRTGVFLVDDGDLERGLAVLDEALSLLEPLPPSPELDRLLGERFNVFMQAGRSDEAEADLRRGLEVLGSLEDQRSQRRWIAASIWLAERSGDLEGAATIARRALSSEWPDPDPIADVMIAANGTDAMLHAATPAEQVEELAADVLRRAEASNLTHSFVGVLLRGNVCWAHLEQGDVAAARELLRPVTRGDPDPNSAIAHLLLGAVELREGHVRAAVGRCRAADAQIRNHNPFWAEGVPWHAEVELWAGRLDAALGLLGEALEVTLPTEARTTAPLVRLQARAHADRLTAVGATLTERRRIVAQLHDTVAGALHDPFGPTAVDAAVTACSRSWHAELSRTGGTATIAGWVAAAAEWDRLPRPHDAAYCRWRAAQVAVAEGRRGLASRLLTRAAADARTHAPLSRAVAATARAA